MDADGGLNRVVGAPGEEAGRDESVVRVQALCSVAAPHAEGGETAGTQDPSELAQRSVEVRIWQVHQDAGAPERIERPVLERELMGGGDLRLDARCAGESDVLGRQVHTDDAEAGLEEGERVGAGTETHVEEAIRPLRPHCGRESLATPHPLRGQRSCGACRGILVVVARKVIAQSRTARRLHLPPLVGP